MEPRSLTARLYRYYGNIDLRVITQALGEPFNDEGTGYSPLAHCRAVVLSQHEGPPLVVAHSILPAVPRGPLSVMFHKLGRQALGSLLFTHRGFERSLREWAYLDKRHPLYSLARQYVSDPPQRLWARRAVYHMSRFPSQSVQVTEVFCLQPPQ